MSFARVGASLVLLFGSWSMPPVARSQEPPLLIDGEGSSASFIVHMRLAMRAQGKLGGVSGQLSGSAAQGWQVLVTVDGRSLKVGGPRWMGRVTRSDSFLAVDRHPDIRFDSAPFSDATLHSGGQLNGQLTLRGLTRPVSFQLLPSPCAQPGRSCDIQVNGIISRLAFGMTAYRATVRDDVDFQMRVRLHQASPER